MKILLAFPGAALSTVALAQNYPTKPIRLMGRAEFRHVPYKGFSSTSPA